MARLLLRYLAICDIEFLPNSIFFAKVGSKFFKYKIKSQKSPKTFIISPKWWNFTKSGHTEGEPTLRGLLEGLQVQSCKCLWSFSLCSALFPTRWWNVDKLLREVSPDSNLERVVQTLGRWPDVQGLNKKLPDKTSINCHITFLYFSLLLKVFENFQSSYR